MYYVEIEILKTVYYINDRGIRKKHSEEIIYKMYATHETDIKKLQDKIRDYELAVSVDIEFEFRQIKYIGQIEVLE